MNIPHDQMSHSSAHDTPQLDAGIGFTAATFLHDVKAGTENASPVPVGAVVDPVADGCKPTPQQKWWLRGRPG